MSRRASARRASSDTAAAASLAAQCAALLRGGVGAARVVSMIADGSGPPVEGAGDAGAAGDAREIVELVRSGVPVGAALATIHGPGWRVLGAAWSLADAAGAPLAPALDRIVEALHGVEALERRREVLLAAPRATVRLVAALPLASIGMSALFGLDPLPILLTPLGGALLVLGLLLQLAGLVWVRRLVVTVAARDRVAGLECELVWIALCGGAPPGRAVVAAADAAADARAEWIALDAFCDDRPLAAALGEASAAGVPVGGMLIETAERLRAATRVELETAAERLGVRVLMPLAVCVLPAFVTLGVLPVVLRMLAGVVVS